MGFRCIKCHKDFGKDKKALNDHMKACNGFDIESVDLDYLASEHAQVIVIESNKPYDKGLDGKNL